MPAFAVLYRPMGLAVVAMTAAAAVAVAVAERESVAVTVAVAAVLVAVLVVRPGRRRRRGLLRHDLDDRCGRGRRDGVGSGILAGDRRLVARDRAGRGN